MRESARTTERELGRTWKSSTGSSPGTTPIVAAATDARTTQRVGTLPRVPVKAENPYLARLTANDEALRRALALAQTLPALPREELGLRASGVRERPGNTPTLAADSGRARAQSQGDLDLPTLRVPAQRARRTAPLAICAAASLAALITLVFGWLAS